VTQIKIALIGDTQSGKSSFAQKYANGSCPPYYEPTLGVDSVDKFINQKGQQLHITFWDMSGRIDFL
jgi:GTPase SAR1 family protein